jgi:hypothetical protein
MWSAWRSEPVSGKWWIDCRITHQERRCSTDPEVSHLGDRISLRHVVGAMAATPSSMLPAADTQTLDRFAARLVEADEYSEDGGLPFACVPLAIALSTLLPICELALFTVAQHRPGYGVESAWTDLNRLAGWLVPHIACRDSAVVIRKGWGW